MRKTHAVTDYDNKAESVLGGKQICTKPLACYKC